MKQMLSSALVALLLLSLCLTACTEETKPKPFTSGDYMYILMEDGTAEITRYNGTEVQVVIPHTIDGYTVSSIGKIAFDLRINLTTIFIPDSVERVETPFCYWCDNLENIVVSPNHPTFTVFDNVLFSKDEKCLIYFPEGKKAYSYQIPSGIEIIEDYAFYRCSNLFNIFIPDSVTTIGKEAFASCSNLNRINIPDRVIQIEMNPFENCVNLERITISPDHPIFAVIDNVLFSKSDKRLICYPIGKKDNSYLIPNGIRIIGSSAFFDCSSLDYIFIPNSVTSIGDEAFYRCSSLSSISIPDSVIDIGDSVFMVCPNLTLTVSRDSYAAQYCKENGLNYTYPDSLDWLNN